jgi:hypothetical protein
MTPNHHTQLAKTGLQSVCPKLSKANLCFWIINNGIAYDEKYSLNHDLDIRIELNWQ